MGRKYSELRKQVKLETHQIFIISTHAGLKAQGSMLKAQARVNSFSKPLISEMFWEVF